MNIVLCGMMGVGKTSVGMAIARNSDRSWVDTDEVIVSRYGRISDLFEYYGEEYFRNIETGIIDETSNGENLVISVGGGGVLRSQNVSILRNHSCKIVYLRATAETLFSRITDSDDSRPLLMRRSKEGTKKRINELMNERSTIYEHVADIIVDTDGKTPEEVAREVLSNI